MIQKTKLISNFYLVKFLDISVKLFFPYEQVVNAHDVLTR